MTDDNLMIGGVPLADLLAGMLPELITRIIERLVAQLPAYGAMPSEELAGDISTITEASLKIFLDVLRTGEMPTSEQLTAARESAARRADEGVPIDAVLSAHPGEAEVYVYIVHPDRSMHAMRSRRYRVAEDGAVIGALTERCPWLGARWQRGAS